MSKTDIGIDVKYVNHTLNPASFKKINNPLFYSLSLQKEEDEQSSY